MCFSSWSFHNVHLVSCCQVCQWTGVSGTCTSVTVAAAGRKLTVLCTTGRGSRWSASIAQTGRRSLAMSTNPGLWWLIWRTSEWTKFLLYANAQFLLTSALLDPWLESSVSVYETCINTDFYGSLFSTHGKINFIVNNCDYNKHKILWTTAKYYE